MKSILTNSGCYLLVMHLEKAASLEIGSLGQMTFHKGTYVYVGRAKANIRKRIDRHLRKTKKNYWHIDYFLRVAKVVGVLLADSLEECHIASKVNVIPEATIVLRFGSSDCKCPGHLIYFPKTRDLTDLRSYFPKSGLYTYSG